MNGIKHILALLNDSPRSEAVLALAAQLAARHGAALEALQAVEPAVSGAYLSPDAAGLAIELADKLDRDRRAEAAARVGRVAARHGIEIPLQSASLDPVQASVEQARRTDLLVLSQRSANDGTAPGFAAGLLVRSGTPLLFVPAVDSLPPGADGAPRCGRRVLVAWAPTRESTRALRDALPLLAAAEQVTLLRLADPEDDGPEPLEAVAAWLQRHGVQAGLQRLARAETPLQTRLTAGWIPDVTVAEALLSYAADNDVDLIVMGGYGHTRVWELALGGVTRTMLQSMTVPVLMSH